MPTSGTVIQSNSPQDVLWTDHPGITQFSISGHTADVPFAPGQEGAGASDTLDEVHARGGAGTLDGTGTAGDALCADVGGTICASNTTIDLGSPTACVIRLFGGGGHGKRASGGDGAYLEFTFDPEASDGIQYVTLTFSPGSVTFTSATFPGFTAHVTSGSDAIGNTPGTGGTTSSGAFNGYVTDQHNGTDGQPGQNGGSGADFSGTLNKTTILAQEPNCTGFHIDVDTADIDGTNFTLLGTGLGSTDCLEISGGSGSSGGALQIDRFNSLASFTAGVDESVTDEGTPGSVTWAEVAEPQLLKRSQTVPKIVEQLVIEEFDPRLSRGIGKFQHNTGAPRSFNIGQTLKLSGGVYVPSDTGSCDAVLLANLTNIASATNVLNVPLLVTGPAAVNQNELEFDPGADKTAQANQIAALLSRGIRCVARPAQTNTAGVF